MELWIGLISGTSVDGVDAALVRVGPAPRELELLAYRSDPLPGALAEQVRALSSEPVALRDLLRLDREIAERFASAALALIAEAGVEPAEVSGIGSHGQTVAHHP